MKVLVITARGLQAGALGAYGSWIETPALDGLAATGIVFEQHFANVADPASARVAWRGGACRLPGVESPGDNSPASAGPDSSRDLMNTLRQKQTFTFLIVDRSRPAPTEFETGWDQVAHADTDEEESALEAVLDLARATLDKLTGHDQWLLWIDLATPLPPWDVPEEFQAAYFQEEEIDQEEAMDQDDDAEEASPVPAAHYEPLEPIADPACGRIDADDDTLFLRIQSSHAAAVSYMDAAVGELLELLQETGLAEEVLVVFTSDVGQALGERGVVGPVGPWPHEEVIHLPLIVRLPGNAEAGRRVTGFTQTVDLAPTLAEAFAVPWTVGQGQSLWPLIRGQVEKVRDFAVAACQVGEAVEYCLRTPDWALLLPVQSDPETPERGPQLFVKPDDRWEVNDVRQHRLEQNEELTRLLREVIGAGRNAGALEGAIAPEKIP